MSYLVYHEEYYCVWVLRIPMGTIVGGVGVPDPKLSVPLTL